MDDGISRRTFLHTSAVLGLGTGLASEVQAISPNTAEEMIVRPEAVQFRPEIEPVVRWIEETPRDQILNVAVAKLKGGLSYRDLMTGLFLSGIRNIKPRPVGFKFHAVMVIHSAHLLGQSAAIEERLLPLFWALDTFKSSQFADAQEGDWTLGPVDEAKLPNAWLAKDALIHAMKAWDSEAADVATVAFCRSYGAAEVMEVFWRYAIRDQRNIGHKPIFAAQAWRTLQVIGWQNAEPVLRSLAFALLDREGKPGTDVVGPYQENLEFAEEFDEYWIAGNPDHGASDNLMADLRSPSPQETGAYVLDYVQGGVNPAAIWDGIVKSAYEILLRQPGIIALHAVTSIHALHFIFGVAADQQTRKMAMLQAASWVALFRDRIGDVKKLRLDKLDPLDLPAQPEEAVADIFATIGKSREDATRKTLQFLIRGGTNEAIFAAARRMILLKGQDSHDYKFGAAAWEEALLASTPRTRRLLTAAMMGHLPSSTAVDSQLMIRSREAVSSILK